ncbi:uncharacterized protein LOC130442445 [Diorhabda sublineata]|uniref:uncharacterized protein LOC130442445 n=1 Tax=Diorhabda sublineata TaxID=1163346 RepID=UPI0024E051CB|nr:uncharacterized protein LOC130442445 [Diorhabda sublineata]
MAGKFSLIFLSFCLVSTIAVPQKPINQIGSITDLLKLLVKFVENFLDNLIIDVNKFIDQLGTDYDGFHSKVVEVTKEFLVNIVRRLKPAFDSIAAKSSPTGQKLATCVENNDEKIISVAVDFFDATSSCAGSHFVDMLNTIKPIVNDLTGVQADAKKAADQINSCGDDDIACLIQVVLDLLQVVAEIPDAISKDVGPLLSSIEVYVKALADCYKQNEDSFYTNGGAALEAVATCAAA